MIVVKIGGAVCDDPSALDALAELATQGKLVIVHGGGPQLDLALDTLGPVERVDGLRVTTAAAADAMAAVFDDVGARLVKALANRDITAQHILAKEQVLRAKPLGVEGLGRVGTPHTVDLLALQGAVIVMGPLGYDELGPLNINADSAALAVATALKADLLVMATDVPAVRGEDGLAIASLSIDGAHALIHTGVAEGGMIPKLRAATAAVQAGVGRVMVGDLANAARGQATIIQVAP